MPPKDEDLASAPTQPQSHSHYRIVTVNLDAGEREWLDGVIEILKRRGFAKATRSELVRLAVAHLEEELRDRNDAEIVDYFVRALLKGSAT